MKMKNPTREQVNFVIGRLRLVREQASEEGAFNMAQGRVYDTRGLWSSGYDCGTVHCVGGWYAVANMNRKVIKDRFNQGHVGFVDGTDLMAQDLGFTDSCCLKTWAEQNPKIWNNKKGYFMFGSASAYDNPGFDGVIAQWETVIDNLPEAA